MDLTVYLFFSTSPIVLNSLDSLLSFDLLLDTLLFEFRCCRTVCCLSVSCISSFWRRASLIFGEGVFELFEMGSKLRPYVVDSNPLSLLNLRFATMAFF